MNYQQFVNTINKKTNQLLYPEAISHIHNALKNNGAERIGLTISQKSTNISPTIYLEEYYRQYQNGWTLDEIAGDIVRLYHEVKFEHSWDVNQVQDFQLAKPNIAYKLINLSKNVDLLNGIPHVPFLDLAIVFFLLLETTERGSATILITKDMLEFWHITQDELFHIATENSPNLLYAEFKPMSVVIQELLHQTPAYTEWDENSMYVLSNHHRHFGAACILYNRVLEDIGNQLNDDFYILPSSIHEVIILPTEHLPNALELNEMISEINKTQVSEEEVLSDHAYFYNRNENKIKML